MKGKNVTRIVAGTLLVVGLGFQNPKASVAGDRGNQASTSTSRAAEDSSEKNLALARFVSAVDDRLHSQGNQLNSHAEDLKKHSRALENHSHRLEALEGGSGSEESSRVNKCLKWISSRGALLAALEIFKKWF